MTRGLLKSPFPRSQLYTLSHVACRYCIIILWHCCFSCWLCCYGPAQYGTKPSSVTILPLEVKISIVLIIQKMPYHTNAIHKKMIYAWYGTVPATYLVPLVPYHIATQIIITQSNDYRDFSIDLIYMKFMIFL